MEGFVCSAYCCRVAACWLHGWSPVTSSRKLVRAQDRSSTVLGEKKRERRKEWKDMFAAKKAEQGLSNHRIGFFSLLNLALQSAMYINGTIKTTKFSKIFL